MNEKTKDIKKVCRCENCGNEAEMNVTCSWEDFEQKKKQKTQNGKIEVDIHRIKGTATCSHCGNEADMWVDI